MGSNAILVALEGYNAINDTEPDHFALFADQVTDHILIKEKARGTVSVNGTQNIAHGLGYVPNCIAFVEESAGVWKKLFSSPIDNSGYWFEINSTNLALNNTTGIAKNFSYYIFYDNIDSSGAAIVSTVKNVVALAKIGKNVFSSNPNDFVFNSLFNTFKIILEGTKQVTLAGATNDQLFTQAHGLDFIPLVDAFAKRSTASQVFKPNAIDVESWGAKLGMTGDVKFNYVKADATNITFSFNNANASSRIVNIRYFCLESIL